ARLSVESPQLPRESRCCRRAAAHPSHPGPIRGVSASGTTEPRCGRGGSPVVHGDRRRARRLSRLLAAPGRPHLTSRWIGVLGARDQVYLAVPGPALAVNSCRDALRTRPESTEAWGSPNYG